MATQYAQEIKKTSHYTVYIYFFEILIKFVKSKQREQRESMAGKTFFIDIHFSLNICM